MAGNVCVHLIDAGVKNSVEVVQSQETVGSAERDDVGTLFSLNLARISLARARAESIEGSLALCRDTEPLDTATQNDEDAVIQIA